VLTAALARLGWSAAGIDISSDQLRVARLRLGESVELVQADAAELPFGDASFDAVVAALVHTDVDDVAPVFAEAARVLRPGGRFVHVGVHPCFTAPGVERLDDGRRIVGPGYLDDRRHAVAGPGVRSRVGVRHVPLAELLNGVSGAGLALEETLEDYGDPPLLLALAARKPEKRSTT
jgi:SAM-dependent methyltransferase